MFARVTPPHEWKEDSAFHYLRLTLVGFEEKDIVINLDKYGHLVVRGDRQMKENEYITFEETFEVPRDADNLDEASGYFENNQIYCITIPKKQQRQGVPRTVSTRKQGKKPVLDNNPRALDNNPKSITKKASSIHRHPSNVKELHALPQQGSMAHRRPLEVDTGDKSKKKKISFFIAMPIALLLLAVVVTFRHH